MKCYCGFVCREMDELKEHIVKTHVGSKDDWKVWVLNARTNEEGT